MTPPSPTLDSLNEAAHALCRDPRFLSMLRRHWPGLFGSWPRRFSARIHEHDPMLLHSLRHHLDPNAAVSQYYNVALQQYGAARQVLDLVLPPSLGRVEVLDFACGFGRLLRFLACCDRDLAIAASDIQPEALRFVGTEFGVETLASHLEPEAFTPGRHFDLIWVASLFSHLPEALFHRWLARLHALLTPRGVLCFSVHDEAILPPGRAMPAGGLLFLNESEDAGLDSTAYGTTYVTQAFVRAAFARSVGSGMALHRLPKALAHEQDLYVIAADRTRDLSALAAFRRGPWGWADERRVDDDGTLVLRGWAASIDDGVLPAVQVSVDGTERSVPTGLARPDVGRVFADPRLVDSGWSLRLPLPDGRRRPWVEVTAHTGRGETALLYAGWPGDRPDPAAGVAGGKVYRREIDMARRSSLSVLAALVPPGARVLDLGTGSGALGRHLCERQRCAVDGVTLSPAERDEAQLWYDRLEVLDLEDAAWVSRFADRRYDAIVCADVLEHLREPEAVLRACRTLLRPEGRLLTSIPNVAYAGMVAALMHGDWTYGAEGLLDRTHLRFYTRRSFHRLLAAEGWQVERVEPIELTWYYTEFGTPFDQLPPAVARYLLAQPDASAYQLVFVARPHDATPGTADATPAVPPPDPTVHVAVYASTLSVVDARGAERPVATLGRVGDEPQPLRFEIACDAAPTALRWWVADRPGYLHLHALRLLDRDGQPCWQWRAEHDGDALWRAARRHQIDVGTPPTPPRHVPLLLLGDQPQIDLPVPATAFQGAPGPWRLEVVCGWPLSADYLACAAAQGAALARDDAVEVVVPVHGHVDLVRRCLGSVLGARCRTRWHLSVIDDASPDAETRQWLDVFAREHPEVTVVRNVRNLGFVGTANLGLAMAGRRDVVLLNSDAEVANDWLDRLRHAAHSGPRVGTVTPFSNNATICSFPRFCEDNALPPGLDTARLDRLFADANRGQRVDVPTAVGFCMYIRRDCLDEIGTFDAETFGAGYGEENDFCLRATARGWRHLHALDVFVRHEGGASFGQRQQELQHHAMAAMLRLHPHYEELVREYIERDPARPYREAVAARLVADGLLRGDP